jgi:maltooligosyltrehalose trehalohydrolase
MNLLPMNRLGARETAPNHLEFGLFLPWVSTQDGYELSVKVIHEADQFLQDIPPLAFPLTHSVDSQYGDYWSGQVDLAQQTPPHARSAWGQPGRYVYRYTLQRPNAEAIDWIIDPFAREFGVGKLSAITVGYQDHQWSDAESAWKTPKLDDLVFYELMLSEFARDIDGAIQALDYLADLGINCLEVMPVSNVALSVDWGFLPIGYFGVDERFGRRRDLLRLIDAAHQRGIAVILDAVYGHTSDLFAYEYVYRRLGYRENPLMGPFAKDYFGVSTDWRREFTRDFFYTVNHYWLDRYHVDGFRYDCVPNYWDGALGQGYANLVYATHQAVRQRQGAEDHWMRFFDGSGGVNLIQCAEQLEAPKEILEATYSNCTWQNDTLGAAQALANGGSGDAVANNITSLGMRFGLMGYPTVATHNADTLSKTALQYIENHDHARFVCNFRTAVNGHEAFNDLFREGDRTRWYKVQPYLIGLLTAKGIPLLWQGQEFGENYWLPDAGMGRVALLRPVRWDYFYDDIGKATVGLVRKLLRLRRQRAQFRRGEHYFYNDPSRYQSHGVLLFSRQLESAFSLVALNFSDADQTVPFWFPIAGDYHEELHGLDNLAGITAGAQVWLQVPSNYGRVWSI